MTLTRFWFLIVSLLIFLLALFLLYPRLFCRSKPPKPCTGSEPRLKLPLWDGGGIFMTRLHLGNETRAIPFEVAVDTGSNILIISGPDCYHCDRNDGVWDMSIGSNISCGVQSTIRFVGGQVTNYLWWRALLLDYSPDLRSGKEVEFGVITSSSSRDGDPLNVLGLQGLSTSELFGGGPVFLDSLCGEKTVMFDFSGGHLYIGQVNDLLPPSVNPILMTIPSFGIAFTMANITRMSIDGQMNPPSLTPRFAIFDTGSTQTLVSPDLSTLLSGQHQVTLWFERSSPSSNENTVSITFTSPPGSVGSSSLPIGSSLLLGNIWLRQYTLVLKYNTREILMY